MERMYLVVDGNPKKAFDLAKDLCLIGRDPANDVVLDSPTVSSHHARLFRASEGWRIKDLNSRNGVVIEGRKMAEALLAEGVPFKLGEVALTLATRVQTEQAGPAATLAMASMPLEARWDHAIGGAAGDLRMLLERGLGNDLPRMPADRQWAESLRTLFQAEGVFFFRPQDDPSGGPRPQDGIAFEASSEDRGEGLISRSALAESLRKKEAVWAPVDMIKPGASLAGLTGPTLLVYPLVAGGAVEGLLHVVWARPCLDPSGVMDHLRSWPSWATRYLVLLWKARRLRRQVEEKDQGRHALSQALARRIDAGQILGSSALMHKALVLADGAAPTPYPVLLLGETGTGKELFARWIHLHSQRSEGPFVALNCAAVHAETAESEIFGHVRGSFTGALKDHEGVLEQASGGTLFLDEIGDMALALQAKLLRALQFGTIRRMGDDRDRGVDLRLVAAANPQVRARLGDGGFRPDLYYRLSTFEIELPPLRDRRADIPLLANHFLASAFKKKGMGGAFSAGAMQLLRTFDWPGNVRQLESVINHLSAIAAEAVIGETSVRALLEVGGRSLSTVQSPSTGQTFQAARSAFEESYLETLLAETGGNVAEASRRSGIPLRTLFRLLKKNNQAVVRNP